MAKIGLNYGEKLQIADKTYRVITDGLNVPEVLGKLSFRGIVVAIHSAVQHETLFFTIADMAQSEIEDLGIKYREEVELEDIVITHTHVNRNDIYKLFASKIKKKNGGAPLKENKPLDNKKEN